MKKLLLPLLLISLNSLSQVTGIGNYYTSITQCLENDSCVSISYSHIDSTINIDGDTIQVIRMLLNIIAARDSALSLYLKHIDPDIKWENTPFKNNHNEKTISIFTYYRKP